MYSVLNENLFVLFDFYVEKEFVHEMLFFVFRLSDLIVFKLNLIELCLCEVQITFD